MRRRKVLYVLEPNDGIKSCVFFPIGTDAVRGNIMKGNLEDIWNDDEMFWKLRTRENFESSEVEER